MFTGIVEELGASSRSRSWPTTRPALSSSGPLVTADAKHGDSIAVNGVCLTVVDARRGTFTADVMAETLDRSSLGALQPGDPVNLERPMAADGRFGGHIVQGHVDGTGPDPRAPPERELGGRRGRAARGPRPLPRREGLDHRRRRLAHGRRGRRRRPAWFSVSLIPTTLTATTLGSRQVGDPVNLEVDVIAKYVERMVGVRA